MSSSQDGATIEARLMSLKVLPNQAQALADKRKRLLNASEMLKFFLLFSLLCLDCICPSKPNLDPTGMLNHHMHAA